MHFLLFQPKIGIFTVILHCFSVFLVIFSVFFVCGLSHPCISVLSAQVMSRSAVLCDERLNQVNLEKPYKDDVL